MRDAPFRFAQIERVTSVLEPEGYKFFKASGNRFQKWLARQLWNGLHRLRALQQYTTMIRTYEYTTRAQDEVTKEIAHHISYIRSEGKKIEDFALIMGGDKFYELAHLQLIGLEHRTFPAAPLRFGQDDGRKVVREEYRGIPIHVVPHMSGIALVPKVILERKKDDAPEHTTRVQTSDSIPVYAFTGKRP